MKIAAVASVGILLFSLAFLPAFGQGGDYLTSEGKLLNKLEIKNRGGGFVSQYNQYDIKPGGAWTTAWVVQGKVRRTHQGTLSKDDLGKLVKELARYDLKGLKSARAPPIANTNKVTIRFGDFGGTVTTPPGPLPAPDPNNMFGRFSGIVTAVKDLVGKP